jgi:hypothetical protein
MGNLEENTLPVNKTEKPEDEALGLMRPPAFPLVCLPAFSAPRKRTAIREVAPL